MANAWCINAYNCDWCLIQTLWTLDSANIWVWVQVCVPDPLDDKRLDYIKYTDKCWNTCCITWENELLIYATQWVIKNLTLTNNDTNEVVNVKRTDIFWSNRKKTVVRYKTWWYPTSITDWTLAVEELVQNQYQSSWYNVSWLSDWTTYYFSAFAVAQDDTIIDMQSSSITTSFDWSPTSNTVAYYKLDSANTVNDLSSNNYTLTNLNWTVFWNYQWVSCAYFNNSPSWDTNVWLYTTAFWIQTNMTVWLRFYQISHANTWSAQFQFWTWSRWYVLWTWINTAWEVCLWARASPESIVSVWNQYLWARHRMCMTKSWTNCTLFIDNVQITTLSFSRSVPNRFNIWAQPTDASDLYWYLSRVIVENVARTQQNRTDYYNRTKKYFWL